MVSLLSVTEQGQTVEVGYTGCEGMVGLPVILGQTEMAYQAMVQVAGRLFSRRSQSYQEFIQSKRHVSRYCAALCLRRHQANFANLRLQSFSHD